MALAGCSKTDTADMVAVDAGTGAQMAPAANPAGTTLATGVGGQPVAVIQGACPQVFISDDAAVHRVYARGATDDPMQIQYQASFGDQTRQCVQSTANLTVNIVAQGRVVLGPVGTPGSVNLPIRVTARDGDQVLYDQVRPFAVDIPAEGTTQFVFTDSNVSIPAGAGADTKIYIGFDKGAKAGKTKRK